MVRRSQCLKTIITLFRDHFHGSDAKLPGDFLMFLILMSFSRHAAATCSQSHWSSSSRLGDVAFRRVLSLRRHTVSFRFCFCESHRVTARSAAQFPKKKKHSSPFYLADIFVLFFLFCVLGTLAVSGFPISRPCALVCSLSLSKT